MSDGIDFDALRDGLRRREPQMLQCYCCGERYERGRYRCCQPPNGMPSHEWAEQWCSPKNAGGCGKCPRHCECRGRKRMASVTDLNEWLARVKGGVERQSVAEIFAEGEAEQ